MLLCCFTVSASRSVPSLNQCSDMVFIDGMEDDSQPSGGSGGAYPGSLQHTILGNQTYYYYVPSGYTPSEPWPLMALWHGTAGAGNADAAAQLTLNLWLGAAEANDFIAVAQVATGSSGGWVPSTDSQILAAIIDDLEMRYNIESTRRYLWGFSAGGYVMHAIALNNANYFSAYAISGADLGYANSYGYTPANSDRIIPVYISVGTSDVRYADALSDLSSFTQAGWQMGYDLWFDGFNGGHEVLNDLPQKAWDKICISTVLD